MVPAARGLGATAVGSDAGRGAPEWSSPAHRVSAASSGSASAIAGTPLAVSSRASRAADRAGGDGVAAAKEVEQSRPAAGWSGQRTVFPVRAFSSNWAVYAGRWSRVNRMNPAADSARPQYHGQVVP